MAGVSLLQAHACLNSLSLYPTATAPRAFPASFSLRFSLSSRSLLAVKNYPQAAAFAASTSEWAKEDAEDVDLGWMNEEDTDEDAKGFSDEQGSAGGDVFGEEEYPEPPKEAKLFVGNLTFDIDSEALAKLFDQAGTVEVAEVICDRRNESRGFGFVHMRSVEEAERAEKMFNGYEYNGRALRVNRADAKAPGSDRSAGEQTPRAKAYVGNMPWQVNDDRLAELFGKHGKVLDARVIYDRETGRSRGFGFVTFSSQAELRNAIAAVDGLDLEGRTLRVSEAEQRPRRSAFSY